MNEETKKEFLNGVMPTAEDFTTSVIEKVKSWDEVSEKEVFTDTPVTKDVSVLPGTDKNGKTVRYCLLSDKRIAVIKLGKGADVERATMEANGDQSKYLSSMMAATLTIDEKAVGTYQLSAMGMKDYMNIQNAFSDINF